MKATLTISVLLAMFCNAIVPLNAQIDFSKFELGINAGAYIYQGDLTPSRFGSYRTLKTGVGIYVNRLINQRFSLRTNLTLGNLKGDDAKYTEPEYRQQRNFNFKSPFFEISQLIVADLLRNNLTREHAQISPYLFTGLGLSFLNIKRDWSRFNAEYFNGEPATLEGLFADQQHSPPTVIPVIAVGAGIRYVLSKKISLTAETFYRVTFSDYVDGFSKSANDSRKDNYHSHAVGLIYRFQKINSLKCPTF